MSKRFAIYLTDEGTRLVSGDLDMDIVDLLAHGGLSIGAIAESIGRSRSTVSARLVRLRKAKIIAIAPSKDSRERLYTVKANRLMHSEEPPADSKEVFLSSVDMILDGKVGLYDGLVESMFYGAVVGGLNTESIFITIAEHIGRRVAEGYRSDDFFGLCERLNDLFRINGIGSFTMTVTYFVKIVFTVEEKYRDSEFKVMETIYRNIIKSAMECNSGKSMIMKYEPTSDLDKFEFELHFSS